MFDIIIVVELEDYNNQMGWFVRYGTICIICSADADAKGSVQQVQMQKISSAGTDTEGGTMDRRQQKTRAAIFEALNELLEKKHFNNITVQEILDEANIGRSTFYAHFETKDALLREMCTDLFDHIFSHELQSETSHDFSGSDHGLEEKITHLLYHLKDNKGNVLGVLSGESGELFMKSFKEYLREMFGQYPACLRKDVPEEFALNHLVGSFAEAVKWWIEAKMQMAPELVAENYLKMIGWFDR